MGIELPPPSNDRVPGTRRILVVEDNPDIRRLAARILERYGYAVTVASDGIEATLQFEHAPVDVVVMDLQMPRMDGLDAAREIRRIERLQHRPQCLIIAMTARTMPSDQERRVAADMNGYIAKPFTPRQLLAAIEALIGVRPDARS